MVRIEKFFGRFTSVCALTLFLTAQLAACGYEAFPISPPATAARTEPEPAILPSPSIVDVGSRPDILPAVASAETDKAALTAFFHATNGASWDKSKSWLGYRPIGEWMGVTADENGRVVELNLREVGLSGRIPPEFGNLTELKRMDLGTTMGCVKPNNCNPNQLSGEIPPDLGNLVNLESARLDGNSLSGEVPIELSTLIKARRLDLSRNELTGEVPEEFGNLPPGTVSFWGNNFTGCVADYLVDRLGIYNAEICRTPDAPGDAETLVAFTRPGESRDGATGLPASRLVCGQGSPHRLGWPSSWFGLRGS